MIPKNDIKQLKEVFATKEELKSEMENLATMTANRFDALEENVEKGFKELEDLIKDVPKVHGLSRRVDRLEDRVQVVETALEP